MKTPNNILEISRLLKDSWERRYNDIFQTSPAVAVIFVKKSELRSCFGFPLLKFSQRAVNCTDTTHVTETFHFASPTGANIELTRPKTNINNSIHFNFLGLLRSRLDSDLEMYSICCATGVVPAGFIGFLKRIGVLDSVICEHAQFKRFFFSPTTNPTIRFLPPIQANNHVHYIKKNVNGKAVFDGK